MMYLVEIFRNQLPSDPRVVEMNFTEEDYWSGEIAVTDQG